MTRNRHGWTTPQMVHFFYIDNVGRYCGVFYRKCLVPESTKEYKMMREAWRTAYPNWQGMGWTTRGTDISKFDETISFSHYKS